MNSKSQVRPCSVKVIAKLLNPLSELGIITVPEKREIISNLKYLSERGEVIPSVMPKLIDQSAVADMLGVSLANFKKLEKKLPFKRRMIGHAVRYRNTDVVRYIFSVGDEVPDAPAEVESTISE